jgi:hypothetical protein
MKDDDLFWFISDFFEQFPPGHQLTIVAKHAFDREYAVNFGPASGGPTEAYHVYAGKVTEKVRKKDAWWFTAGAAPAEELGTKLEESYNPEITRSSAHFNLIPKGGSFLGSTEGTYIVGDNGWEKDGADSITQRQPDSPARDQRRYHPITGKQI